ncbi:unnamed protein product, partial [Prorocentrum cordatum]
MAGMGITTETRQRENKAQRDRGTGRTDRVCAGRAPMSGQHAAVRKRALALRAENVATPGERARNPGTKRAVGMTDEHGRHKDILVLYVLPGGARPTRTFTHLVPWGPTAPVLRPGRAGQRPGGRPTARRPFPADRAALGPSGGRAARRRVHHVLVARRTQLEARLLVRVLGLVVGLLLRNAHAPHPLLPFLP